MSVGNSASFIGRLTRDPEVKVAGQSKVCNFTLARNRFTKDKDHPESDFMDCVVWNASAELLEKYFHKGSRVGVSGELRTRTYEDTNGVKRKVTEILVNNIEFIDSKASNERRDTSEDTPENENKSYNKDNEIDVDDDSDDLPF